jgi:hypothetical protein
VDFPSTSLLFLLASHTCLGGSLSSSSSTLSMGIYGNFECIVVLGFELRSYTLSHSTSFFVRGIFEIGSHELFALAGFVP